MSQKSYDKSASLYLIPTPIGNLEDITMRSLRLLKEVNYILCEDTRTTGNLLKKYGIKNQLVSCYEFNENSVKNRVIADLKNGKNIGLVTDQGTPIISDPGYKVVQEVIANSFNVIALPGATAFVPALITSAISPSPFLFYGFLSAKTSKQKKELEMMKNDTATMIFYEAPHRIRDTLMNMREILGERRISLSREISEIYEEIYRGTISDVLEELDTLKGELVIVVEGNTENQKFNHLTIAEHVCLYLDDGMNEKDAIKLVAKERNVLKGLVYQEYHNVKGVKK